MTTEKAPASPHNDLVARLRLNDGYVLNRHRLRALEAADALAAMEDSLREACAARDALEVERGRAAHDTYCETMEDDQNCDCWKSRPPAAYLAEHDAKVWEMGRSASDAISPCGRPLKVNPFHLSSTHGGV